MSSLLLQGAFYSVVFVPVFALLMMNAFFIVTFFRIGVTKRSTETDSRTDDDGDSSSGERDSDGGPRTTTTTTRTMIAATTTDSRAPSLSSLPDDVVVRVGLCLHPRAIASWTRTDRAFSRLLRRGPTARALWESLWYRDHGRVLSSSSLFGREALERSCRDAGATGRDLRARCHAVFASDDAARARYLAFRESWLAYVTAGLNDPTRCVMGLHGHAFDFTGFAPYHPGLVDDVVAEGGGGDATGPFERERHSSGARRIAERLCVIADKNLLVKQQRNDDDDEGDCGLVAVQRRRNDDDWTLADSNDRPPPPTRFALSTADLFPARPSAIARRPGTLATARAEHDRGRRWALEQAGRGHRVFYDPLRLRWREWYRDDNEKASSSGVAFRDL